MADRVDRNGLQVAADIASFVEAEALPGTGIDAGQFWSGLAGLVSDFTQKNGELLEIRARLVRVGTKSLVARYDMIKRGTGQTAAHTESSVDLHRASFISVVSISGSPSVLRDVATRPGARRSAVVSAT